MQSSLRVVLSRIKGLFRHRRDDEELRQEIEQHLATLAERYVNQGLTSKEAWSAAQRQFGGVTRVKELNRERRTIPCVELLLQDGRYAFRQFCKTPGFTAVTIAVLALGLSSNIAIFSIINAALLRPLPVPEPNELVMLTDPNASLVLAGTVPGDRSLLTYPEYAQLRDHLRTVSGLCAAQLQLEHWPIRVAGSAPERVAGRFVSESYFSTFGVRPAIGRFFTQADANEIGKDPYAVISYRFWQRRFDGSPAVIGTTVRVRRTAVVIIGVAQQDFRGETVGQEPDLWLPILMQPVVMPEFNGLLDTLPHSNDKFMWLHVFGRRKSDCPLRQVQAEVNVLFRGMLEAAYSPTMRAQTRERALRQHVVVQPMRTGAFHGRKEFKQEWILLLGLASLILIVACANVVNLLLARGASRSHEVAVRVSLGAGTARLVRQFLTENLLMTALGGISGFFVAEVVLRALLRVVPGASAGFSIEAGLDGRVLVFGIGATLATGLLSGIIPAARVAAGDVNRNLKEASHRAIGSHRRAALARAFVVAQMGLSVLLIVGAGLFLRTLWNLQSVDLGFPPDKLLLVQVDSSNAGYEGVRTANLFRQLSEQIGQIPGVRSVTYSDRGLFTGFEGAFPIKAEGFASNREQDGGSTGDFVGPAYFSTIRIPIRLGREIQLQDSFSEPRVCVINEAFAKRFFAGRNPLGKHVTTMLSDNEGKSAQRTLEVIGVAGNARVQSLRGPIDPKFYVPGIGSWLEIRTAVDPAGIIRSVQKSVSTINPDLAVQSAKTLKQTLSAQDAQPSTVADLATAFGSIALIMAAMGIYGLLSFELGTRTNEIGIRMALGAQRTQVIAMILRETGGLAGCGVIAGIAVTAAGARLLSAQLYGANGVAPRWSLASYEHVDSAIQLYGISAMDPATIAAAVAVLCLVAIIAADVPAARAARIDPAASLRSQ
ncbi:MAG TPA: ABC transporter permease [Bryobacteraceae bacterium]|jgi:predicted permease|nr:ABC transporter permease [Bryobacteraceae bacterium]